MDLRLDFETHDLALVGYDLALIPGIDLMRQRLKQSLLFFMGEWFLDLEDGVPYYRDILVKTPDRTTVESAFKSAIIGTPGVTELLSFEIVYDNPIRHVTVHFSVATVYGNLQFNETI